MEKAKRDGEKGGFASTLGFWIPALGSCSISVGVCLGGWSQDFFEILYPTGWVFFCFVLFCRFSNVPSVCIGGGACLLDR